jgi:hypothetical protein
MLRFGFSDPQRVCLKCFNKLSDKSPKVVSCPYSTHVAPQSEGAHSAQGGICAVHADAYTVPSIMCYDSYYYYYIRLCCA